jgi:ADP-ribosylglycohydrolase
MLDDGRSLRGIIFGSLRRMVRLFTPELAGKEMQPEMVENPTPWTAQMQQFIQQMMLAMSAAEENWSPEQVFGFLGEGWVGDEALIIAVYCVLKYPDSIEDCLSAAVTHDGDSDSTGAIAGNILGAWLGEDAIPADWLEKLELREVIRGLADQLYEAAQAE